MSGRWSIRPLGELAAVGAGNSAPQADAMFTDGTVPFLRTSDVGRIRFGDIETAADLLNDQGARGLRRLPAGTILFPKSGASTFLNHRVMMQRAGCVSSHLATITAKPECADPRFLLYFLSTVRAQDLVQDHAYPSLNLPLIAGIQVPTPPVPEQRRIVAILDEAFEAIVTAKANAEKNLQNAREVFTGHLQAAFSRRGHGWVSKTVRQWVNEGVLVKPQDGNHGEIHPTKADYVDVGVPFIMAADMIDGVVDTEGCRFIAKEQASALRIGFAKAGDVLLSHKGTIGRVAVLDTCNDYVILTPQVTYYRSLDNNRLFNGFLYYCLLSPEFQATMARIAGAGSTRAYIGITRQLDLQIALPPIDVQRETAAQLRRIDDSSSKLAEICEAKLAALDELKKSILHQAFTGQLSSGMTAKAVTAPAIQPDSPEFSASIISLAYERHRRQQRERTFGHVKEQKLLHLVESITKVDLGRRPMRDAAGPNDLQHQIKAENWARQQGHFDVVQRDRGYELKPLAGFDALLNRVPEVLGESWVAVVAVIDLLVPMSTREAEVFATVHAAWNNLLIDGLTVTDEVIVRAARDDWHPDKLAIPEVQFHEAIALIRAKRLVPDGSSKYVGGQTPLL